MGLPAFLFVITLVVFVHELGHFLMARAFGVKQVDVFSVGFGKGRDFLSLRLDRRTGEPAGRSAGCRVGGYVKFAGDADAASRPGRGSRFPDDGRRAGKGPWCSSR